MKRSLVCEKHELPVWVGAMPTARVYHRHNDQVCDSEILLLNGVRKTPVEISRGK